MKIFNPRLLYSILQDAPNRCGITIKEAADRMGGISANHLARQLNPDDPGAKLGIEDFVFFTAVTDNQAMNYLVDCLADEDMVSMKDAESCGFNLSLFLHRYIDARREAMEDGNLTKDEIIKLQRILDEILKQVAEFSASVREEFNRQTGKLKAI